MMNEAENETASFVVGEARRPQQASTKGFDTLSPHEVDGFWLQRLISTAYPDPVTATDRTASALNILSSEANLRDCENELMDLFDYDKFDLVRTLTKNRDVIVWCTKLSRSDENDRLSIEVAMREKGVGWILRELSGDRTRPARGSEDVMDVDPLNGQVSLYSKLPPQGSQPRQTVDLEGMAFSQGGRLMSNKKVTLPDGSFKRSKRGYEEIYIPAPKSRPLDPEELVPIESLPLWARPAFKGARTLNRVQSKLYHVAFGTDEPILLCAPTGAGKVLSEIQLMPSLCSSSRDRPMWLCSLSSMNWGKRMTSRVESLISRSPRSSI